MLWEGLLQQKTLFDAVTLDETMSLTWYSSQKLDPGIHLPSRLQSLTFGERFNQSLEGIQLPNSQQPAEFDVCHCAQPEFGGHPIAQQVCEVSLHRIFLQPHGEH